MILAYLLLLVASLVLAASSLVASARGWRPSIDPRPSELIAGWTALIAAVVVACWLLFAPLLSSRSTSLAGDGAGAPSEQRVTLLEAGELAILPIVVVVVAITVTPLLLRRRRSRYWVELWGALILAAFSFLSGFSIGPFLLPIAALMWVAAMLGRTARVTA